MNHPSSEPPPKPSLRYGDIFLQSRQLLRPFDPCTFAARRVYRSSCQRSCSPIYTFALLCSAEEEEARAHARELQLQWGWLLDTETLVRKGHLGKNAQPNPLQSVHFCNQPLCRLLFMVLERSDRNPCAKAVQVLCRAVFKDLGDSKVIEDTHQRLRDLARDNKNPVSARVRWQEACISAGVLQSRGIDTIGVDAAEIVHNRAKARLHSAKSWWEMAGHTISDQWQDILGQRTWQSPAPGSSLSAVHAWQWVKHCWSALHAQHADCKLSDGWPCSCNTVIGHAGSNTKVLVLLPGKWAASCIRLASSADQSVAYSETAQLQLEWVYIPVQTLHQWEFFDHVVCCPAYI